MSIADALGRWLGLRCASCAIAPGEPLICDACRQDFLDPSRDRCARCAIPLPSGAEVCGQCLHEPPLFDATVAVADYAPPFDGMVLALKFGHRLELASLLGQALARKALQAALRPQRILAVPLAFERLAERGFNQSLEIARAAARVLDVPCDAGALQRVRHAVPQASLHLAARRRNVRGAFAARGEVRGLEVAVVDDVMTTGSTLDEVARVLKAAGAARVVNLVVARTP